MSGLPRLSIIAAEHDWLTEHLAEVDASGLYGLYIADHPSFATTDSWTWLAFAAAATRRLRLGTHVTGASFHHPTRLAKQVASVDALSGGRAVLGIGTGYEVQDYEPYGFTMPDFAGRVRYLEELLQVIQQCFAGELQGFDGEFFQYRGQAGFAPRPDSPVPLVIGLNKAGLALQVAARHADAINTWQLGPGQVADIGKALGAACLEAGRPADAVAVTCDVLLAPGASREQAAALAHRVRDMARGWGRKNSVTRWEADGVLHGDGEAMLAQLADFGAAGATEVAVAVGSMDDVRWLERHLLPRLAISAD